MVTCPFASCFKTSSEGSVMEMESGKDEATFCPSGSGFRVKFGFGGDCGNGGGAISFPVFCFLDNGGIEIFLPGIFTSSAGADSAGAGAGAGAGTFEGGNSGRGNSCGDFFLNHFENEKAILSNHLQHFVDTAFGRNHG